MVNFKDNHTQVKRSATAHISSCSSPNVWTYSKTLMEKKYGLNFRLQGAWKSCTVRISVCHLLQMLSVFYMYQDTLCNFSPSTLLSGTSQCSLFIDWHICSCSTREDLIKAASFDNTFHSSSSTKRKQVVLNMLNQVTVDRKWENY